MKHLFVLQPDGSFKEFTYLSIEEYIKVESKAPNGSWVCNGYSMRMKTSAISYSSCRWEISHWGTDVSNGSPDIPKTLRAYLLLVHNLTFQ